MKQNEIFEHYRMPKQHIWFRVYGDLWKMYAR